MCIRDRLNVLDAPVSFNNNQYRLVASAAPCAGTLNSTAGKLTVNATPVSYTHLDVYKRQSKWRPERR